MASTVGSIISDGAEEKVDGWVQLVWDCSSDVVVSYYISQTLFRISEFICVCSDRRINPGRIYCVEAIEYLLISDQNPREMSVQLPPIE